jgi:hypothetical protein
MKKDNSFRTKSREDYHNGLYPEKPTTEQLQLGCLQRIADATEIFSKSWRDLTAERDFYERKMKEERENVAACSRLIRDQRVYIKRLKTQIKNFKNGIGQHKAKNKKGSKTDR